MLFRSRTVSGSRVAYTGTAESYPFSGADLTNRVVRPQGPAPDAPPAVCRQWAHILTGFDYLVVAHAPYAYDGPPERVVAADPAATFVAGDAAGSLYRLSGPFTARAC